MNISDRTALLKNSLRAIFVTATLTLSAVSAAQEYTVNLKDTDIQEFIKFVADVTGTTMVVDGSAANKSERHDAARSASIQTQDPPQGGAKAKGRALLSNNKSL